MNEPIEEGPTPLPMEWALSRIHQYAIENKLSPQEVCDMFLVGIAERRSRRAESIVLRGRRRK